MTTNNIPAVIEIQSVEIENLKNIEYGKVSFQEGRKDGANIVGIYGQNGSGKTALLDAVAILREAMIGLPLSQKVGEKVSAECSRSHFVWTFSARVESEEIPRKIVYSFDLVPTPDEVMENSSRFIEAAPPCRIENEMISVSRKEGDRMRFRRLIDTGRGSIFGPRDQFIALTGGGGARARATLQELRKTVMEDGGSFVFSPRFLRYISEHSRDKETVETLTWLNFFSMTSLHVLSVREASLPALDMQTLKFSEGNFLRGEAGSWFIPLDGPVTILPSLFERLHERLKNINYVLGRIIPGQQIELIKKQSIWDEKDREKYLVEVMSRRDGKLFPFRYESDGIKKLVAILELLSQVYARPGVTLAVDELDSGIFEYLLGELLEMLANEGEGQLIFTSHNLHPMERLHPGTVVQTTVDPRNRFTRRKGVRDNNNLRKQYMRDVLLHESRPAVYEPTNTSRIAAAMQEIGAMHE